MHVELSSIISQAPRTQPVNATSLLQRQPCSAIYFTNYSPQIIYQQPQPATSNGVQSGCGATRSSCQGTMELLLDRCGRLQCSIHDSDRLPWINSFHGCLDHRL